MQYKNNYLIQKIDESIEGVLLDTATPVSLLLQYVPSCKAICIDFYYYSFVADEPYLNQLFEGLQNQLEIFYLKNARIKKLPKSLWAAPLKQIHLNLQHSLHIKIELPYLFDNQLESINIKGCEQEVPSALFHSKQLKKVILSGVSTGYDGLLEAENLETLMLHDYPKTTLEISLQGFKNLKHLELNRCNLEMLPDLSACTQLETLILTDLSRLQNLEINWNALQNLQRLELSHLNFLKHTTLLFNELPILKVLYIGNSNLFLTKNSLGKMPALQAVALRKLSLKYFPKRLLQSNTLLRLFIQDCTYLEAFAFSIASYPLLTTLGILNCPKIVLSNKILIHPNLTKLNYDFQPVSYTHLTLPTKP
jgi:Leucine-rich repeat (LRR) protein